MDLLALASRHREWLALRQTTVAENISNADTPGYSAAKIRPFTNVVKSMNEDVRMSVRDPGHIGATERNRPIPIDRHLNSESITHSGNTVRVEDELLEASAVRREYALNTSITHAFRRMIAASAKV